MPNRYRFDLESNNELIRDMTGIIADDITHANEEATAVIREMRDSGELPEFNESWTLVIRDEDGAVLKQIPL